MDLVTVTTAFATTVSLLADFVSHRNANEAKDFDSFMNWLAEERHDEVRALLNSNAMTTISIKALLNQSRDTILDRLSSIDKTMALIASGIDEFRDIALIAHPTANLSTQALSVLEQFYDSGATAVLEVTYDDEIHLMVIAGPGNLQIQFSESRFIEDDLSVLVELGLLELSSNSKGDRIFKFKRTAAAFVEKRRQAPQS